MRTTDPGDAAGIELLLAELRLPAVKQVWASLATRADKEGWPAGRFLAALAEHEIAERARRRLERHLAEARLPPGKTLDTWIWCVEREPLQQPNPADIAFRRRERARNHRV
jgi:DNA replication protein DnaC